MVDREITMKGDDPLCCQPRGQVALAEVKQGRGWLRKGKLCLFSRALLRRCSQSVLS